MAESLLAKADAQQKARVKRCTCGVGYRVEGIEYDTGGCMDYGQALSVSRHLDQLAGGAEEYARRARQRRRAERV